MKVEVIAYTPDPCGVISIVAGTSTGKKNKSMERLRHCLEHEHMSVFEHVMFTARIDGVSRSCTHQLVRHRLISACEKSQRYTKIDTKKDWYVLPKSLDELDMSFEKDFIEAGCSYNEALDNGIKPEDARYLLPEGTKTTICVSMNARELFHILELRTSIHAQWEIRDMVIELMKQLEKIDGWKELINEWKKKVCW